jgi:CRP/FNR family cyclic AMP-dependent transcriptional regulator
MPVQPENPIRTRAFDKRRVLLQHPLFGQLGAELVDRLSAYAKTRSFKRGQSIFAKGDPGTSLFAICAGSVKISVPSLSGKDAIFNVLGEGDIFGEIALLDGQPRTADAVALGDCELLVIERRDFLPVVQNHPEIALKLIEVLCARLRHSSEQVEDVMFLDLPGRLAKTLLRLSERANHLRKDHKVPITQREIGQIIGMSRESTNKQLRSWEEHKWVRLERGGIVVLAPDALAAIAATAAERAGD